MKKTHYQIVSFLSFLSLSILYSCGGGSGAFQTTESGIQYKILQAGEGEKIKAGDFVDFHMVIKNSKDSVLQNTYIDPQGAAKNQQFPEDSTKGGLIEAFQLLAAGDSAIVKLSNDSLLVQRNKGMQARIDMMKAQMKMQIDQTEGDSLKEQIKNRYEAQLKMAETQMSQEDPNLPKGGFIEYTIKILAVKSGEEVKKEQEEAQKKAEEEAKKIKEEQTKVIEDFLKKEGIEAQKSANGVYYVVQTEGSGAKPELGEEVKVSYVGRLFDGGKVFDTSDPEVAKENEVFNPQRQYAPYAFKLGQGEVIPGWDDAIIELKKGSKATLYIPSDLAYRDRGTPGGNIPPNAILTFDIELLDN